MSNEQTQQADDPSGPDNQLANRIRAAMLASGLTRYQLSQQTGVSQAVLGRFASGERDLTLSTASRLVPTLGLDLMATDASDIEPQPSDSEPETMEDLRRRLVECEVLLAEAERGGEQVNAELQQLREQLATSQHLAEMSRRQVQDEAGKIEQLKQQLWDAVEARQKAERELKDKNDTYQLCLQNHYKAGQRSAIDKLQAWLKPVLEVVAENPEDSVALALAVLADMPAIAARLIEE